MEPLDLSVSIVNYNTRELLHSCLSSIFSAGDQVSAEVIVVDNASTDGSADMVARDFPSVRLLRNNENLGFARANNQAFLQSHGRCFLLLNSDTIVLPGPLEAMIRFLDEYKDVGMVAPRLLNRDKTIQASVYSNFPSLLTSVWVNSLAYIVLDKIFVRWEYPGRFVAPADSSNKPREVPWVTGACLLVRSSLYRQLGMLDERFFLFYEETDLCKRVHDSGWKIYHLPISRIVHLGGGSCGGRSAGLARIVVLSEWKYHCKHYGLRSGDCLIIVNLFVIGTTLVCLAMAELCFFWNAGKRKFFRSLARDRWALFVAYTSLAKRRLRSLSARTPKNAPSMESASL